MKVVECIDGEMTRHELQNACGLKHRDTFMKNYLTPAIAEGYIELTIPDKPRSRLQKYRLTEKGRMLLGMKNER